jgi:hypothetical protein
MLPPKFGRKLFPTLLLIPLLLLLLLLFLSPSTITTKPLANSPRSLNLLFIGVEIPSQMLLWLKFVKLSPKVVILLLL